MGLRGNEIGSSQFTTPPRSLIMLKMYESTDSPGTHRGLHRVTALTWFTVYFVLGWASLVFLAGAVSSVLPIWLPAGISFALQLRATKEQRIKLTLVHFLVELSVEELFGVYESLPLHLTYASALAFESFLAATLASRFNKRAVAPFDDLGNLGSILAAACIASFAAGTLAAIAEMQIFGDSLHAAVATWMLADIIGIVVLAPLALLRPEWRKLASRRFEAVALFATTLGVALALFGQPIAPDSPWVSLSFILFPPLIWAALSFGVTGASAASLLLCVLAGALTELGLGPIAALGFDPFTRQLISQGFIGLLGVCALTMGVLARQQRMTQEALRKTLREAQDATARFQSFFDGSPEMLAVVDREGQLILANRRWRSEVGASNDGQPGTQALVPANAWTVGASAATMHEHWQAALQGRVSEQALSTTRPDGSVQELEMSFAPLVDHTGDVVGAYTSIRDVGLLRKRQQDQANARRLESIGRLAGGIAHDFNNIITGIQGYAQLLALALPPDHEGLQDLREIVGAGDRAANLTRQLLAFARSQVIEPKCVDLAPLVDQMASLLRRVIGDERNFAIEIDDNVWPVLVDPGQLEQVLMNLVINARDATKEDGKIVLSAKNEVVDADNAGIFEIQAGAYIVVAVQDDGIGMPPDVRARIFEPFFTTKGPGKGTGLGLATVEGIVRQLGGCIRVESEPGNGTTFRAYFPRAMAGAAEPIEPGREAAKVRPASETILLVEDDPSLRALNARILEKSGFRVLRFADGSQALRISELELSRVAVLITDVVMQETNGFELANQLRQRVPQLPVLFVSGYVDHEVLRQFAGEGEVTLLGKPFAPDELVAKVGQILGAASSSDRRSMPDVHAVRASIRAQCTRPT